MLELYNFKLQLRKKQCLQSKNSLLVTFIDFYCLINTKFWITNEKNLIKKNHY